MEQLAQLGGLSYKEDEIQFNCCYLAYRAMTIADVITGEWHCGDKTSSGFILLILGLKKMGLAK
jgi:hypothetical protein